MEAIASGTNKKRYLKSKADEIRSLKRRFEQELSEIEILNGHLKSSDTKKEIFSSENIENAKNLLKETDTFLRQNQEQEQNSYKIQDSESLINNLMGDGLRKERAGELFQYGFEVKYLPLARYLQTASKYISTDNWCAAREEFRLARVFDRYLELRAAKATTLLQIPQQQYPSRPKTQHDAMLEEVPWMSNDFRCETEWKIKMARQLAVEAREVVLKKFGVWSNTKAVSTKVKPNSINSEAFYRVPSTSNPIFTSALSEKIDSSIESGEIPIDRDELADLCDLGDKIDNSILGDLITTAEYQLGTSASFPSVIWYEHEDALLLELSVRYKRNWLLISSALNTQIYGGKSIRGPQGCQERLEELEKKSVTPKPQLTSPNPPLIHPHLLEKHNVKLGLMRGSSTKIITPRSIVPKKISFNVHPSHEAAARKANQNISKLLTPSELAQKRLQRTRLVNETGTLNVPSIPRSTPSPSPSATGSAVNQSTAVPPAMPQVVPGPVNPGTVPNLPPMPSVVPNAGPVYNNSNASAAAAAAQQIAAGMMRSGMMRPPPTAKGPQTVPPANPMIAQLQQLQQQMQIQQVQQQQMQQPSQFSDSPSKTSQNFRPGQVRPPPSANGPINFMNLPPGITPLQIQQLQQKQVQAQQAAQLQQMYAKTMQARPPNPSTNNLKVTSPDETSSAAADQSASNNPNLRTIDQKASRRFSPLFSSPPFSSVIPSAKILSADNISGTDSSSVHRDSPNLQVKLENEKDVFKPDYKLPGSPDSLPYRKIWDVSFYNNKAELISLHEIAKSGPFIGVASAEKSEGVKDHFKNRNYKISLHPVIEYSLELPYGRQARIWITTETACYRIMSVSANYISYWQPFYEMVCFAGHVVNILLNYSGPIMMVKLVGKVAKLSGKGLEETYESFKNHRKFIQDLLKDQNLSAKIRKEYNALQSNQANWEISWEDHLKAFEKKNEKKEKVNILSFFRSKSDENGSDSLNSSNSSILDQSSKKPSTTFDDSSSLLSISEDESATYIEFPYETLEEMETEKPPEDIIKGYIGSSFTSSGFLEWKLSENGSSLTESYYNCPLCKITFKTGEKDCISAFSIHLKAHRADCEPVTESKIESIANSDFESRFSSFRADLQKLITGKVTCNPIPLKFEKKINEFTAISPDRPFTRYAVLDSEEVVVAPIVINPIRILKFSANVGNSPAPRPPPSAAVSTATAAAPAQKKPRVKKPPAPKPVNNSIATDSTSSSSSMYAGPLVSPQKPLNNPPLSAEAVMSNQPKQSPPFNSPNQLVLQQNVQQALPIANRNNNPVIISNVLNANTVVEGPSRNVPQGSPINNTVYTPSNVLYAAMNTPLFTSSRSPSPTKQSVPVNSNIPKPVAAPLKAEPKSIIVLDRDSSDDLSAKPEISPLQQPQQHKRPSSAVPVPIEIFSSEDSVVTPPVPGLPDVTMSYTLDGAQLGCAHYKVNCKFYAECCGKWFPCRFCHDSVSDHKLNRHETRFCLCMFCGTSQKASGRCVHPKCNSVLAHYFCEKCKFWDNDANKLIYHCEKCGICRAGLKDNYAHCDRCEKCVSKKILSNHDCVPAQSHSNIQSNPVAQNANVPEKRPKLDNPIENNNVTTNAPHPVQPQPAQSSVKPVETSSAGNVKPNTDQTNYVNYLKNSLAYWRNKGVNGTAPTATAETTQRRNCWNCMNALPSGPEANSKYCLHCSAIIE